MKPCTGIAGVFIFIFVFSSVNARSRKTATGCTIESGVFIAGGNNVKPPVLTAGQSECSSLCFATNGCVAWTFRLSDNICWLKSDDSSKGNSEGWITGTKACGYHTEDEVIFISDGTSTSGGYPTAGTTTEVLDISSSSSPCSRTTGDLPDYRRVHSMDKMGDAILICGGESPATYTSTSCVSSRNASGPWLSHSTTNSERQVHSSAIADGRLHLLGGIGSSESTMESFDEGGWTEQRLPYSIGCCSCSVQTSHNSFIVTGGSSSPRKTWEWKAGTWTELEEMKVDRVGHACGTIVKEGKVFLVVAGGVGREKSNAIQSSEVFAEGEWQDMGDLVKARGFGAKIVTVRVGGIQKMIIMGGKDINGNELNSVEGLVVNDNVGQSTWQLSEATMKKARSGFGAVSVPKSKFCDNLDQE